MPSQIGRNLFTGLLVWDYRFRKHFLTMSEADGRLHVFNVYWEQWSPLTDSERLVSDVSSF